MHGLLILYDIAPSKNVKNRTIDARKVGQAGARNNAPRRLGGQWVVLPPDTPTVPEYYNANEMWPKESLERRAALMTKR